MGLALAIDLGTTNLKVGIVDQSGKVVVSQSLPLTIDGVQPGQAEQDPEQIKQQIIALCKEMLTKDLVQEINYIVSSSYQFGLMVLDEDMQGLTGMTVLTDVRAQNTFEDFKLCYREIDLYKRTGCPLITPYILPRLFFFSKMEESLFSKARYFTDSKSMLFQWLTGEFVTDISIASASQFFNIASYSWDEEILGILGLEGKQFPRVEDGTKYVAQLKKSLQVELGLKDNVKVVLGVYDGAALAIGLSGLSSDIGVINIGTSAMIRIPSASPAFDLNSNQRIQPYALTKNIFLNGGALNNAALPLNWLRKELFDIDFELIETGVSNDPSPLFCLPYLTSERDSEVGPYASGVFFGLRNYHTRQDMGKAVLEGVAYSLRFIYEALLENGLVAKKIYMGGGGVQIKCWPQLFADVLGVPIFLPPTKEMGLSGNAVLAFASDDAFTKEFQSDFLHTADVIIPDENQMLKHEKRYTFFKSLRRSLGDLFVEHGSIMSYKG
jgi:gluconokinase